MNAQYEAISGISTDNLAPYAHAQTSSLFPSRNESLTERVLSRGRQCLTSGDLTAGEDMVREFLQIPDFAASEAVARLHACVLWSKGRKDEALRRLNGALQLYPHSLPLLLQDASLSIDSGLLHRAWSRYVTAVEHYKPYSREAIIGLSLICFMRNELPSCLEILNHLEVPEEEKVLFEAFRHIVHRLLDPTSHSVLDLSRVSNYLKNINSNSLLLSWYLCEACLVAGTHAIPFIQEWMLSMEPNTEALAYVEYTLGRMYHQAGQYALAEAHYGKSLHLHSDIPCPAAWGASVTGFLTSTETNLPLELLRKHFSLDAGKTLAAIYSQQDVRSGREITKGLTHRTGKSDPESWALRGMCEKENAVASLQSFSIAKSLCQEPNEVLGMILLNMCALHLEQGHVQEARACQEEYSTTKHSDDSSKSVRHEEDFIAAFNAAALLVRQQLWTEARDAFENLCAKVVSLEVLICLAICEKQNNNEDRCKSLCRLVLELDPRHTLAKVVLCSLHTFSGPPVEFGDHKDKVGHSLLCLMEGNAYFEALLKRESSSSDDIPTDYPLRTLSCFRKALQLHPTCLAAQHNTACVLALCGELSSARILLELLLAMHASPEADRLISRNLCTLHHVDGHLHLATSGYEEELARMCASSEHDSNGAASPYLHIGFTLASLFVQQNRLREARQTLQKICEKIPDGTENVTATFQLAAVRIAEVANVVASGSRSAARPPEHWKGLSRKLAHVKRTLLDLLQANKQRPTLPDLNFPQQAIERCLVITKKLAEVVARHVVKVQKSHVREQASRDRFKELYERSLTQHGSEKANESEKERQQREVWQQRAKELQGKLAGGLSSQYGFEIQPERGYADVGESQDPVGSSEMLEIDDNP